MIRGATSQPLALATLLTFHFSNRLTSEFLRKLLNAFYFPNGPHSIFLRATRGLSELAMPIRSSQIIWEGKVSWPSWKVSSKLSLHPNPMYHVIPINLEPKNHRVHFSCLHQTSLRSTSHERDCNLFNPFHCGHTFWNNSTTLKIKRIWLNWVLNANVESDFSGKMQHCAEVRSSLILFSFLFFLNAPCKYFWNQNSFLFFFAHRSVEVIPSHCEWRDEILREIITPFDT